MATEAAAPPLVCDVPVARRRWFDESKAGRWAVTTGFFLLLPFALLSWLLPFVSSRTIGNDYVTYGPLAQLDLMWSVWKGTYPLYLPGFAGGGHSVAALTLGQLHHPISWLSSMMPGYATGLAIEWNTFFRLISLGLSHLALYCVCRRLAMGRLTAFLCTFPAVYNLRMLDSFRYSAALEGYTGMLLVVAAGFFVFLDAGSKRRVILLAIATYLTAVSGHPQWAFFGMLGAMLLLAVVPWLARAIDPGLPQLEPGDWSRYARRVGIGLGAGVLLSAPYALPFFFEFFRTNQTRAGNANYDWTLAYSDSWDGEWANLLLPLQSDVHGAVGGSAFLLLCTMLPLALLVKRPPLALLFAYLVGALAAVFALGGITPVHKFISMNVPMFGSFRTPGRILMWVPIAALPVLAWLLRPANRRALGLASAGAFAVYLLALFKLPELAIRPEGYSPHKILGAAMPPSYDWWILHLSGATLGFLLLAVGLGRRRRYGLAAALACALATTWLCLSVGTWPVEKSPSYSFDSMADDRSKSPAVHSVGHEGYGLETRLVAAYKNRGHKLDRPLGVIVHGVSPTSNDDEVLGQLRGGTALRPVFIDGPLEPNVPEAAGDHDTVSLVYNTSNRFQFNAVAAKDGYFVLGLPLLPGFVGRVDGAFARVTRANTLYPAVFLPRGFHVVDFYFISWPFLVGVAIAFATLGALAHWGTRRKRWVTRGMLLAVLPLAILLWLFLYQGPSFNTEYFWKV